MLPHHREDNLHDNTQHNPEVNSASPEVNRAWTTGHEEKQKLRKHFGRVDLLFFLICVLVGLDTIGTVANIGAQGFTWLVFLGVTFFVPYALLTAELGSSFPEEGGSYIWTRMAFGRLFAAITSIFYWASNPIWLGGTLTITAITAITTLIVPLPEWARYVVAVLFIWFTVGSAIVSFRYGRWVANIGAWARFLVLCFFTLTTLLYAWKNGLHGFSIHAYFPTYAKFIAAVPVVFFNYVGFEVPSAAAEEMPDPQRDIPAMVARSAVGTILLYGLPVLAILLVLPQGKITSLGGFIDTLKAVFTVYGGHVAADGTATLTGAGRALGALGAFAFVLSLISSAATWIMGADRVVAVACYDGAGPRGLGRFSARFGTPVAANLLSGVLATLVMILAFALSQGDAKKYFSAVLGLAISTTTLSYLGIFPALIRLRYTRPDVPRPYRVPGGKAGVWMCGVIVTLWALFATITLLWPGVGVGWFGTSGKPDDSLPGGFAGQRLAYEMTQILPLVGLLLAGLLFYPLGAKTRAELNGAAAPDRR
jgi:amino acid transporter